MNASGSSRAGVCILGATGSIGSSTLEVLRQHRERYRVVSLLANSSVDQMLPLLREFEPEVVVMVDADSAGKLREKAAAEGLPTEILQGEVAAAEIAADKSSDIVMAAIVGAAGLRPTLAAVEAGKRVLLANKESLVMSGALMMQTAARSGAQILPVDSEHNAIFQCLPPGYHNGLLTVGVEKMILTASGGPFRGFGREQLTNITPEQAVAHPNWSMGAKISVDSATLMNKGLEFIEACWLFAAQPDQIEVVVHPQSVVHSMVQYIDGSVLAQLGAPDMCTPIACSLSWPERIQANVDRLDWSSMSSLEFEAPDNDTFPSLAQAREAMRTGGTAPAVLNAANEVAVHAFLQGRLSFLGISEVVDFVLNEIEVQEADSIEGVLEIDARARNIAKTGIGSDSGRFSGQG